MSTKEAIRLYNQYTLSVDKNRVYMRYLHGFFTSIIQGALFNLKVFPDTIGQDKYKDLTQDMFLVLLSYISRIDGQNDIRDIKGYLFITVRNRIVNYLKLHNKEVEFNYSCQEAARKVKEGLYTYNPD